MGPDHHQTDAALFDSEYRVDPRELVVGHFVSRLDRPWRDSPFPLEGVMVLSEEQRDWFADHCAWVVIDLLRSRSGYRPPSAQAYRHPPARREEPPRADSAVNMLRRARLDAAAVHGAIDSHDFLYRQAGSLIDSLRRTGRIDVEQARLGLRKIAGSLESNIAAMVWLTRIRRADEHVAEHCVNVAILGMGLARALEWDDAEVERAGLAGLLHDLGKLRLEHGADDSPGRRTGDEHQCPGRRARVGYELLSDDERIHPDVARAVLEHHERPDGRGLPDGKTATGLLPLSMAVAVVNAYDAMTSPRPGKPAISHHEALGALWRGRRQQFDAGIVETLIQFLGWVAPGILVRLSNGDFAVVLQTSQEHRLWPVVRRLRAAAGGYEAADRLDLARETGRSGLKIDEVLPDGAVPVDLNAVLLQEAVRED